MREVLPVALLAALASTDPAAARTCTGDCDHNGEVSVDELVLGVNVAVGAASLEACTALDASESSAVEINELVQAVSSASNGCRGPVIVTVAGSGVAGVNQPPDGFPPLETYFYLPQDVTMGPDGHLYIVDWNNHRIRRENNGVIETVAGTGEIGPANDGLAIYTQFNHPTNVEFDRQGRMIIAAWHNSLVKRLDLSTGMVENLAGTGARAFGGDGGPGNAARLDLPSSVAIDSNGNIVISDQANFRLRLLEPNGIIHTICGTGIPGYAGDGGRAENAQLNAPRGQSAPPAGRICIDSRDRIYIADSGNHAVRMIDSNGTITTIAGKPVICRGGDNDGDPCSDSTQCPGGACVPGPGYSGDGGPASKAQLDTPSDVAIGPEGNLYIADTMNDVIRVITLDGKIDTYAGNHNRGFAGDGKLAYAAELNRPYGIGVAPNGDLYIADTYNHRVRLVSAGLTGPPPTPVPLPDPQIIACSDQPGTICTYAGFGVNAFNGDGLDRLHTALYWPFDIEFTPRGHRYVLDWNNHKIREILPDDTFKTLVGTDFVGDGPQDLSDMSAPGAPGPTVDLNHPTDIQEFPNGDLLFVAWHNHKLRQYDPVSGLVRVLLGLGADFAGDGGPAFDARANQPARGVLDANGNFFFVDQRNQRIRVIYDFAERRGDATIATIIGTGVKGYCPALPPATPGSEATPTPTPVPCDDGTTQRTRLSFPSGGNPEPSGGITIDANGTLYFADTENHRIRRVTFTSTDFTTSTIETVAGSGQCAGGTNDGAACSLPADCPGGTCVPKSGFGGDDGPALQARLDFPQDIELGPDGNLYFCDTNNNRVRRINLNGCTDVRSCTIETIAGSGEKGYGGDGGPAVAAKLNRPFGLAFDAEGNLYVSDTFNGRIRKIKLN